jgi:formate hydrogenlyase subunit 3/multisubunit Na+/H+ antiporter MnhD subunit
MPALAADAPALVTAFIFTAGQAMSLYLLLVFFQWSPLNPDDASVSELLLLGGMVMATSGGIMAAVQEDFGRLFGYAALSNLGILLMALPSNGAQSLELVMFHGISRAVSITLLATSLATLRLQTGTDRFNKLQGMGGAMPIASFGLILGILSLAGFPLTAGFATQWAVTRALWNWAWPLSSAVQGVPLTAGAVQIRQWLWFVALIAIVASSAGIVIGALRGLGALRGTVDHSQAPRQPILGSLMIGVLIVLTIGLGLYPQLFIEPVQRAAQALSAF